MIDLPLRGRSSVAFHRITAHHGVQTESVARFLLASDSVHTTAEACDYLAGRLTAGDEVTALAVADPDDPREAADAPNVATARIFGLAIVETVRAEGDPAVDILDAATDRGVDEVPIGARSGAAESDTGLGGTARAVLSGASVPVVVVPVLRLG